MVTVTVTIMVTVTGILTVTVRDTNRYRGGITSYDFTLHLL